MTCKVWVQDAWWKTAIRADQILSFRSTPLQLGREDGLRWQLDAVVAEPIGDNGSCIVPLLHGSFESFDSDVPVVLLRLIAAHLDDDGGGLIGCANEETAVEIAATRPGEYASWLDALFTFAPFSDAPPQHRLRRLK